MGGDSMDDDNLCPACDGSGGGDYPMHCMTCGGRGELRRATERDDGDDDTWDFGDEPCNAEVRW
jgi:DnaJ-class molecular chaperone